MPTRTAKGFAAQLDDAFSAASADWNKTNEFKDLAKKHPVMATEVVRGAIPRLMQRVRKQTSKAHGVDWTCYGSVDW